MTDRYVATGAEAQFEPGSRGRVLRNLLGIRSVREMQRTESSDLVSATRTAIEETGADQRFTAEHIRRLHYLWLGKIYPWAGQYRGVNLSKGDFPFAAASQIPRLMERLDREQLREYTPCRVGPCGDEIELGLAAVHVELVLIHPFRDGNGRWARLVATLMALQAGLPPLDFSGVRGRERQRYFQAVHAAVAGNLAPMMLVFERIVARTLRRQRS
jgi:cell filamentation protein